MSYDKTFNYFINKLGSKIISNYVDSSTIDYEHSFPYLMSLTLQTIMTISM